MTSKLYYSATESGFYSAEIHGDDIPEDAVEITEEEHTLLLGGQSAGKQIVPDEKGYPVLVDPPPPTLDQLSSAARSKRDALLTACDWVVIRSQELGDPVPQEWADYRQALRDVPEQAGFPEDIDWPAAPETV